MASPRTLNDGQHNYVLVREARDLGNGLADVAVYDRVPATNVQYTPDLAFTTGQTSVPMMMPLYGPRVEPETEPAANADTATDAGGGPAAGADQGSPPAAQTGSGRGAGMGYVSLILFGLLAYLLMRK